MAHHSLFDSRLGKQINFYYFFCMPALFSRDWHFHHTTTQRRDNNGGGRHERGRRTKRRLISSVALWLSLSPFFTLTSLSSLFPCAGSVLWYYQHCFLFVLFIFKFLVLVAAFTLQYSWAKNSCNLLLVTLLSSLFASRNRDVGLCKCSTANLCRQPWNANTNMRLWRATLAMTLHMLQLPLHVHPCAGSTKWRLSHCASLWATRTCWLNPNTLSYTSDIRIKV